MTVEPTPDLEPGDGVQQAIPVELLPYEAPRDRLRRRGRVSALDAIVAVVTGICVALPTGMFVPIIVYLIVGPFFGRFTPLIAACLFGGASLWMIYSSWQFGRRLISIDAGAICMMTFRVTFTLTLIAVAVMMVVIWFEGS